MTHCPGKRAVARANMLAKPYSLSIGRIKNERRVVSMNNSPIVCYCKNVTEAEIIEHVAYKRCCSTIEDIQKHTGANTGSECSVKNPSGT